MASTIDPWDYLNQGRYHEFLHYHDVRRPLWQAKDWREPGARATALLLLDRFQEAIEDLQLARRYADSYEGPNHSVYSEKLGGALWMAGRQEEAAQEWLRQVNGLLDGSINYADSSGGTQNGMLLRFAGIQLKNIEMQNRASILFKKLIKKSRIKSWPGPLAFFALGKKSMEAVALENFGTADVQLISKRFADDILMKRQFCQLLFYWSHEALSSENASYAKTLLTECEKCGTYIEIEWHLARHQINFA